MKRFSLVQRYLGCQDGATAVEFGLISPVLFLLVMGIVEAGLIMSAQNTLESATYVASRTGRTGFVETAKTQEETIMDALEERATDGANTFASSIHGAYGYRSEGRLNGETTNGGAVSELNDRLVQTCTNMKNAGVTVYTVAFGDPGATIEAMMEQCASQPD